MLPNICPDCGGHGPKSCLIRRFYTAKGSSSGGFWDSKEGAWEAYRRTRAYLFHHFSDDKGRLFDAMPHTMFRVSGGWIFSVSYSGDSVQHDDDPILQWVYAGDNGVYHLVGDEWDW